MNGRLRLVVLIATLTWGCGSSVQGVGSFSGTGPGADAEPVLAIQAPSCAHAPVCSGFDCCMSRLVPHGTFRMGRGDTGSDACPPDQKCPDNELPEHEMFVNGFYLDAFEVTVDRFRRFVDQYEGTPPPAGAGANPAIEDSGWDPAWNEFVPASRAELMAGLHCSEMQETWTDTPGEHERLPIDCASWIEAFLFCVWDGGRLPTEAEWEYAAAGGDENRLYPWGNQAPDVSLASYDCLVADDDLCSRGDIVPVGSLPAGAGRWGHFELAGNMREWVLDRFEPDWYQTSASCNRNCANVRDERDNRGQRGGNYTASPYELRAANRGNAFVQESHHQRVGFRCARDP